MTDLNQKVEEVEYSFELDDNNPEHRELKKEIDAYVEKGGTVEGFLRNLFLQVQRQRGIIK